MLKTIILAYALSITATPDASLMIYDETFGTAPAVVRGPYYLESAVELSWRAAFVCGSMVVEAFPRDLWHWTPSGLRSAIGAGLRFGGLEIGLRHWCQHPVVAYAQHWRSMGVQKAPAFEGGQTQIYLSLSGSAALR